VPGLGIAVASSQRGKGHGRARMLALPVPLGRRARPASGCASTLRMPRPSRCTSRWSTWQTAWTAGRR
jgi:hypothetical protein